MTHTTVCPGCEPAPVDLRGSSRARASVSWLALLPAVLSTLAPKCPMCLVAYLSVFGVTLVGAASAALALLRPLSAMLAALALAFAVPRWTRRLRGRA